MGVSTTQDPAQASGMQTLSSALAFDLQDAAARARVLRLLGEHRSKFSAAERGSYDALRDECVRIARKQGDLKKAGEYLRFLSRFLSTEVPVAAPPADLPAAAPPTPSPTPSPSEQPAPPQSSVKKAPDHAALRFVERSRIGRVHASAHPAVPPAPKGTPDAVPVVPQAERAQAETVPISAPIPEVIKEEAIQGTEAEAGSASTQQGSVQAIAQEVEVVNAGLNEFADGKAFQWLHNPESGYREYMQELMSLRSDLAIASADAPADVLQVFETRLSALRANALSVESAVGKKRPEIAEPVSAALPPQKEKLESPLAPQPWKTVEEASPQAERAFAPAEPLNIETRNPFSTAAKEGSDSKHVIENKAAALNDVDVATSISALQASAADSTHGSAQRSASELLQESPTPAPTSRTVKIRKEAIHEEVRMPSVERKGEAKDEIEGDTPPEPAPLPVPPEPELVAPTEIPVPPPIPHALDEHPPVHLLPNSEGAAKDPLYTQDVAEALDDLLTKWLGGRGWLGLKKGGIEHHDWLIMAPLRVQDVIENDGYVPEGLTHEFMQNLDANVREWGLMYHIPLAQYADKTIEELMRRIVFESLKKPE